MTKPLQGAARALARATATYAQLQQAGALAPLLAEIRPTCLAPWLDAGLVEQGEPRYTHGARVMGDYVMFDGWHAVDLALPDGEVVLRMTFWLTMNTGPTGTIEGILELSATEFIGGKDGRCSDMQVTRKRADVEEGSSCWPHLSAALVKEFVARRDNNRSGAPFPAILQCLANDSLDWLVP
jgi:hypothetical protein